MKNAGRGKGALKPEYQELKFTLHRKLLDKINLEALATIDNQRVRGEVRNALMQLIDGEQTLLSSVEKQQICDEVLDEVFGVRAAGTTPAGPHDFRHSGQYPQERLCRT